MAPPAQRIKLDRKALREPDEFQTLTKQAAAWAQAHRPALVGVGARRRGARLGPGGLELVARPAAPPPQPYASRPPTATSRPARWPEAAEAFAGLGARLRRDVVRPPGGALRRATRCPGSQTRPQPPPPTESFLAASPETDYLKQEALLRPRQRRARRPATRRAPSDAYEEAAALDGPFRIDARLAMARRFEAAGQADKAREQYQAILKDSPSASVRELLRDQDTRRRRRACRRPRPSPAPALRSSLGAGAGLRNAPSGPERRRSLGPTSDKIRYVNFRIGRSGGAGFPVFAGHS